LAARLFGQFCRKRGNAKGHHKRQKRWTETENLSGRSVLAVRRHIQAKLLAMNLAAILRNVAQLLAARLCRRACRSMRAAGAPFRLGSACLP
jgi:hypothetical protein